MHSGGVYVSEGLSKVLRVVLAKLGGQSNPTGREDI